MKFSKEEIIAHNLSLTFGADSRAVGSILQISQRRTLLLTILGRLRLIALWRFLAGLPRLRGLLLLLLLLLLRVGRHCLPLSPVISPVVTAHERKNSVRDGLYWRSRCFSPRYVRCKVRRIFAGTCRKETQCGRECENARRYVASRHKRSRHGERRAVTRGLGKLTSGGQKRPDIARESVADNETLRNYRTYDLSRRFRSRETLPEPRILPNCAPKTVRRAVRQANTRASNDGGKPSKLTPCLSH